MKFTSDREHVCLTFHLQLSDVSHNKGLLSTARSYDNTITPQIYLKTTTGLNKKFKTFLVETTQSLTMVLNNSENLDTDGTFELIVPLASLHSKQFISYPCTLRFFVPMLYWFGSLVIMPRNRMRSSAWSNRVKLVK